MSQSLQNSMACRMSVTAKRENAISFAIVFVVAIWRYDPVLPVQVLEFHPEHSLLTVTNCRVSFCKEVSVVFARPELEDVSNVQVRVSGLALVAVPGFDSLHDF